MKYNFSQDFIKTIRLSAKQVLTSFNKNITQKNLFLLSSIDFFRHLFIDFYYKYYNFNLYKNSSGKAFKR